MVGRPSPDLEGSSEIPQNPTDPQTEMGRERFSWKNGISMAGATVAIIILGEFSLLAAKYILEANAVPLDSFTKSSISMLSGLIVGGVSLWALADKIRPNRKIT